MVHGFERKLISKFHSLWRPIMCQHVKFQCTLVNTQLSSILMI